MTGMVVARHLSKRVTTSEGELVILKDINLSIDAAETVAIVGASGSGKSTLLGLMAGLDSVSGGEMWLDGNENVVAFVQRVAGSQLDAGTLQAWIKPLLTAYKRPSRIVFMDALPTAPSGKVLKHKLKN